VTPCLDPRDGVQCRARLVVLLALVVACAPRSARRAVEPDDAGGVEPASDASTEVADAGGAGGTELPGDAAGGAGGGGVPDASADQATAVDSAVETTSVLDAAALAADGAALDAAIVDLAPGLDLAAGLVHRWKFDEGTGLATADSGSRGNNGTLSGGGLPDWTAGGAPIPGNPFSLTFDGVDDYVALSAGLAPVLGGTATLSCWLKTNQKGADNSYDAPGVTGVEMGNGSNDIFWGFLDSNGLIGLRPGSGTTVKSASPVNDNKWHNVVMTRDKDTGRLQMFVDGQLIRAIDGMQTGTKTTAFNSLGRITGSSKPYFKGQLDDVRIWDRVLTAAEVAAVFAGH
jgi:hypothetical protein